MPVKTITNPIKEHHHGVILTPDDILTLKLLREEFGRSKFQHQEDPRYQLQRLPDQHNIVSTLERILKQVS